MFLGQRDKKNLPTFMMKYSLPDNKKGILAAGPSPDWRQNALPLALIILAAAAIRLYALHVTAIVNPDGVIYIHQARAVSTGEWRAATCSLPFLSNTSLLISLFHLIFTDWLMAARAMSLLFGTLAIIPLFGLLRQFFPKEESLGAVAVLAFLPTWVSNSVDVVRDPVCWFFSLYGLYWLARGLLQQRHLLLPLACLAFLLAAWARIEALWYPAAACLLLPLLIPRHRVANLLWFSLPLLAGGAASLALPPLLHGPSLLTMSRLEGLGQTMTAGLSQYTALRESLAELRQSNPETPYFFFLAEARNLAWLVGLGTVANRLCEALTYPFTLIALLGIGPLLRRNREHKLAALFCLLAAGALGLLYLRTLQTYVIDYRYMMLAILPGTLCFCAGLAALVDRIQQRTHIARLPLLTILAVLLILVTLPRDLAPRGESETAFKEIGLFLAASHTPGEEVRVATSRHTVRLVRFYANLERPGIPCPERPEHLYPALTGGSPAELIKNLKEEKIDYLLWEERNRPSGWPPVLAEEGKNGDLQELGRWFNQQTGMMTLYRVRME